MNKHETSSDTQVGKLGLLAGGGELPIQIFHAARENGIEIHSINLRGFADPETALPDGEWLAVGEVGRIIKSLQKAEVTHICFVGNVTRPDFNALKLDSRALRELPSVMLAARKGDDALLRAVIHIYENEGFIVVGAKDISAQLLSPLGVLGAIEPTDENVQDLQIAQRVVHTIGVQDIGQGAVVCEGLVLAVEAQEGTDEMLRRCVDLPAELTGSAKSRKGVLVKLPKPAQETRVDLPTLGVKTIQLAAEAGLAGVGFAAGASLLLSLDAMIETADKLGLFLIGVNMDNKENE